MGELVAVPVIQPDTSIVVPILNEVDNLLPLIKRIHAALPERKVEVLFVDDSRDDKALGVVDFANLMQASENFVVNIYHRTGEQRWGGLSGAVADGITRAKSDQIVIMDGDLQHPPETLPAMIKASNEADLVVASRYREGGSANGLDGFIRHFVSRGSIALAKLFFPRRLKTVSDPMTGFFLIKRQQVDASRLRPKGFKILLEILATHPKLTVAEVPLQFAGRVAGESHGNFKQGLEFFDQLVRLRVSQFISQVSELPKFIQFGAIGGGVFIAGMALLYLLVEVFSWSPLAANALQLLVTFLLNYQFNRKLTWKERNVSDLALHKFVISRAVTTGLNYMLFVWLVSLHPTLSILGRTVSFSINYLAANVFTLVLMTILNYVISDRWAFAEPKEEAEDPTPLPASLDRLLINSYAILLTLAILGVTVGIDFILNPATLLAIASLTLFVQASIEVWRMMYAYRDPNSVDRMRFPVPEHPQEHFCVIVPARHESAVLGGTLHQLAKQTHPNVTIVTVICDDDLETLKTADAVAAIEPRVQVVRFPLAGAKPNKPKQLNYVFELIKDQGYTVVGVVDAEDTVHPELLMHIDAAFRDKSTGIVQGGVQLINHDSSWYSLHNVLEYYRWFNSTMSFQADNQFMPLGGNTIFVSEDLLRQAGGWPETLTEDCSLGVLLSTRHQTKTVVHYEPWLATREETPDTIRGLFKQRVRWNQGFFHEWRKGVWRELPTLKQRMLAEYVLLGPVLMAAISILMPLSLLSFILLDAPVGIVMIMCLPLIPSSLNVVLNAVLLRDFGQAFEREVRPRHYVMMFLTQMAYQVILSLAAFWAIVRELRGEHSWYKTSHSGQHRVEPAYATAEINAATPEGSDASA